MSAPVPPPAGAAPPTPAPPTPAPPTPSRGRGLGAAVVAALIGGGLAAVCAGRPWFRETAATGSGSGALLPAGGAVTGSTAVPLALAAGLVGLAAAGALLACGGTLRRVVGGLLAALAAAGVVATVTALADPTGTARAAGAVGQGPGATVTGWPFVALVGLLAVLAAGLRAAVAGADWPTLGRRYERRLAGTGPATRSGSAGPAADWDAVEAGLDPTVVSDPAPDPALVTDPSFVSDPAPDPAVVTDPALVSDPAPVTDPGAVNDEPGRPVDAGRDTVGGVGVPGGADPSSAVGAARGPTAGPEQR